MIGGKKLLFFFKIVKKKIDHLKLIKKLSNLIEIEEKNQLF